MAAAHETTDVQLVVSADFDAVVAWFAAPERREEQRSFFSGLEVDDFAYDEHFEADRRVTRMSWTAPSGRYVVLEFLSPTGQTRLRDVEGKVVFRDQMNQYRRWPNGREDRSSTERVTEFTEPWPGATRLRVIEKRHKEGVAWWERWVPPVAARQHRRQHLLEMVRRCEQDLAVR